MAVVTSTPAPMVWVEQCPGDSKRRPAVRPVAGLEVEATKAAAGAEAGRHCSIPICNGHFEAGAAHQCDNPAAPRLCDGAVRRHRPHCLVIAVSHPLHQSEGGCSSAPGFLLSDGMVAVLKHAQRHYVGGRPASPQGQLVRRAADYFVALATRIHRVSAYLEVVITRHPRVLPTAQTGEAGMRTRER